MKYSLFHLMVLPSLLGGCTATDLISRNLPSGAAESIHIYSRNLEPADNLIDKALANCPDETEKAEAACVQDALSASTTSLATLVSALPGCAIGSICTYDHTTQRRLGLIPAYATIVKKDWRVAIDLRGDSSGATPIPVTVSDRDVFVVPPPAAPLRAAAR